MRAEYNIREKKRLRSVVDEQAKLLKVRISTLEPLFLVFYLLLCFHIISGAAISKAVEKVMHEGLSTGITHGAEGRKLANVVAYNPSAKADYLSALQRLQNVNFSLIAELKSNKDASVDTIINLLRLDDALAESLGLTESQPHANQLMVPIHHSLDQRVIGASALSFSLDISHSRVRKIKENIASHVSALYGVFVPLSEPLFAVPLEGTEGTFSSTHDTITALSVTFVFACTILHISTDDYEVAHADGQEGASVDGETVHVENINPFCDVSNGELNILERSKLMPKALLFLTISTSVVLKVNSIPFELLIFKPASEPSMHDDPSVNNIYGSGSSSLSSIGVSGVSSSGRSMMKSARICPFTDVLGQY
nr:nonaspanin [Tanacetum cinerariifolium]